MKIASSEQIAHPLNRIALDCVSYLMWHFFWVFAVPYHKLIDASGNILQLLHEKYWFVYPLAVLVSVYLIIGRITKRPELMGMSIILYSLFIAFTVAAMFAHGFIRIGILYLGFVFLSVSITVNLLKIKNLIDTTTSKND